MKFLELFEELLLALCVIILLPLTTYWGVNIFYQKPKYEQFVVVSPESPEHKNQKELWNHALQRFNQPVYYSAVTIGLLAVIMGVFVGMPGISTGLIGGGIVNILMALFFSPANAIINFGVLLSLLCTLLVLMFIKKKR